ncbi:hypothetical protein C3709_13830 [Lelliottia aquatilis]|uniref:VOC domain-containing protein n=1 Tax=Lelliottia aquatilis TaxID=2080838 RepID=A0ABX5A028_9ENTR|nr:hypothetical protein C3708_16425 [Lelliottia sp. 7254-16]POZ22035.1 hypothetical protein C3712_14450 [Lelliottia aquatilis]POZ24649.1 hypothetical protein C3711_15195 [Lelliottia aquatilis]POZ31912.1 hypothetical protein C3710_15110 [Lelliottia aquatilis]POZ37737.1 hypothetical protein C3709_13830 [Lelliottia aquatilis]
MKADVQYAFHYFGIPLPDGDTTGKFSASAGMYTTDTPGKFWVQWHRFTDDSPLHPLLKTAPHVAFKVSSLAEAIAGEKVILGPYEPIDDYRVAVIDDCGVPIELIETSLSDEELWACVAAGQGSLYREPEDASE